MKIAQLRAWLTALAVLIAVLYSCSLPLWEGWDEPFHYGYVESLAVFHEIPVLGQSTLTKEIANSFLLTPLPSFLAIPVKGSTSLSEWHLLPVGEREARRRKLLAIPPAERFTRVGNLNYEAQQTPLAYLALTPFDWLFSGISVLHRIVLLRLVESVAVMIAVVLGLWELGEALKLEESLRCAALLCCLCTQTLWAAVCHVGNDGFAIALTIWFCALLAGKQRPIAGSLVLAAGLLTKAYFLAFVPVFYLWLVVRARPVRRRSWLAALLPLFVAGPWYLRNIRLYGSLSGTQETAQHHVGFGAAVGALPHLPWLRAVSIFWRASLWTGNWSGVAFSRGALYAEMALMAAGLAFCFAFAWRRALWVLAAGLSFGAALMYQTGVTFVASGGTMGSPEPWYGQGILACVWLLVFLGLAHVPRVGKMFQIGVTCLAGAIALVTFPLVLLPFYGGGGAKITANLGWWSAISLRDLGLVVPVPAGAVMAFCAAYTVALSGAFVYTIRGLRKPLRSAPGS